MRKRKKKDKTENVKRETKRKIYWMYEFLSSGW